MKLFIQSISLVGITLLALEVPAFAQSFNAGYSAAGLRVVPRYLEKTGDMEVGLLGGAMNLPSLNSTCGIGQFSATCRFADFVELFANSGSLVEFGARGKLYGGPEGTLGWDAAYRMEAYLAAVPGFGVLNPFELPDSIGRGVELNLNAMRQVGAYNFYLSPLYSALNNRTAVGAELGADYIGEQLSVGYSLGYRHNLTTSTLGNFTLLPEEVQHSLGLQYRIGKRLNFLANYRYQQANSYNLPVHSLFVGMSYRFSINRTLLD